MNMSDHHEDETSERLNVMLHQEETIYRCRDYFALEYDKALEHINQVGSPPLCFAEECAMLTSNLPVIRDTITSTQKALSSPNELGSKIHDNREYSPSCIVIREDGVGTTHLVRWRAQMCAWAYRVVETFGMNRSIVAIAFNFLDRYLSKEYVPEFPFTKEEFQLLCMSSLSLAAKTHGMTNQSISIFAMTDMSYGLFSVLDFEETELHMLDVLQWRMSPPIPCCFLTEFWRNWRGKPLTFQWVSRSRALLDSSVVDAYFVQHRPSQVAVAALLVVGRQLGILKSDIKRFCVSVQDIVDVNDSRVIDICDRLIAASQREKATTTGLHPNYYHGLSYTDTSIRI
mmetsp:Transcript_18476/g.27914  ORF Transcript_18476/g.27914 Transcript_18476/m.27914 type:complete len:343 (+) Transcript_18476:102-1130(+)